MKSLDSRLKTLDRIIAYLIRENGRTSSNFISELFNDVIEAGVIINVAYFMKEDC
jgi:hypothetical protein